LKGTRKMAIKYFINEEKRQVIGLLENTRWDAFNKINKMVRDTDMCIVPNEKYMMPHEFRVVVQCDERDEFNPEIGKKIAKQRILDRYYPALDKRVNKFFDAALVFNGKVFKTPEELENTP
jgi:hypothetical protein